MLFLYSDELIFTKIFEHFYDPFAIKAPDCRILKNTKNVKQCHLNNFTKAPFVE